MRENEAKREALGCETRFASRFAEAGNETTIAYAILRKNLTTICVSKCITIMFVQCTVFRIAKYFEALFWALLPAFTVCLLFRMSFKFIYIYY